MRIPHSVSQVSAVAVAAVNASGTNSTSVSGSFKFIGVMPTLRGEPNTVVSVNGANYQDKLGAPLHPTKGTAAMCMRYLKEALAASDGFVVPVVAADAKRPVLSIKAPASAGQEHVVTARSVSFDADITTEAGELFVVYPVDGDVEDRTIAISPVAGKAGYFKCVLKKPIVGGGYKEQLSLEVSFDPELKDEHGNSAFIADKLGSSKVLGIKLSDSFAETPAFTSVTEVPFAGGTRGNLNALVASDYDAALSAAMNTIVDFNAVIPLGCVDTTVLQGLANIVTEHRVEGFFDVPANLSFADALTFVQGSGIECSSAAWYHFPYETNDIFFSSSRALWGISSIAYGAKVKSVNSVGGAVAGFHISPAGEVRGAISRAEPVLIPHAGEPDFEAMVNARINKVGMNKGKLFIDDALTATSANNYMKYQHVNSVFNAITRAYYVGANALKHSTDGVTRRGLENLLRDLGNKFTASGALVPPRNPEQDGTDPFTFSVQQEEFDHWTAVWSACPTGSARRISGQPVVMA